jgi:uncharacterized protein YbaP (TraB family)
MPRLPGSWLLSLALLAVSGVALVHAEGEPKSAPTASRKPFLWVVDGDPVIYLFGTIHVPDDRVLVFSDAVQKSIAAADCVITEVPVGAAESPEAQRRMLLPEGKTIADVLPKDVVDRLHAFLKERGQNPAAYDRVRPWAIAVTLQILDFLPQLAVKQPMDVAVPREALKTGKECAALETADEQFAPFEKLTDAQQAKLLSTTIDQLESAKKAGRDPVQELVEAYLSGDEGKLFAYVSEAAVVGDEDMKVFRTRMIEERNTRMVDRLLAEAAKRPGKTLFVMVGAAHFAGDGGITALLQKKGRSVRRLSAEGAAAPASAPAKPVEPKPTPPAPPPQPAPVVK